MSNEAIEATVSDSTVRQAVVFVHGMGEQRPLDTLFGFIDAALPGEQHETPPQYFSRPVDSEEAYEYRKLLMPEAGEVPQTEFYEYHWAHQMQGNQLSDMWMTFWRILVQFPWKVPDGLRGLWVIVWATLLVAAWLMWSNLYDKSPAEISKLLPTELNYLTLLNFALSFSSGLLVLAIGWALTHMLPKGLTTHFVDVIRYLDTSPRSYAVRKSIRKGMVTLLQELHVSGRYQRVVIVAHSLGAYIAYDGITYFWTRLNKEYGSRMSSDDLKALEDKAEKILAGADDLAADLQTEQVQLWRTMRAHNNPWLVSDFVSIGTPMYMADQLMTRNRSDFNLAVKRRHIATCPPQPDERVDTANRPDKTLYSYGYNGKRVLYHAAPFAATCWTNIYFPTYLWFFGDWFGNPLGKLFGHGIRDVKLTKSGWRGLFPALAHIFYFSTPAYREPGSATYELQQAMDLTLLKRKGRENP